MTLSPTPKFSYFYHTMGIMLKSLTISTCLLWSITTDLYAQESQIKTFIESYYNTMSARDWSKYEEFFSDDATLTTIWAVDSASAASISSFTISDFLAQTQEGPDSQPIFEEKPLSITVEQNENMASVWVKYKARFGSKDHLMEWQGYDLFTLLYHQEQWYIVSLAYVSTTE